MRSSLTSASRFLWSTSLGLGLVCLAGCPSDPQVCGPGDAPAELTVTGTNVSLTYGNFEAGLNNDCPGEGEVPGVGVTSLSIQSRQVGGIGFFTLCVERPDRLNAPSELGPDENFHPVRVVDVSGEANGCDFNRDTTVDPTGTAQSIGLCNDARGNAGGNAAGFAFTIDGTVTLERDCAGVIDTVAVTLSGEVAVAGPPQ